MLVDRNRCPIRFRQLNSVRVLDRIGDPSIEFKLISFFAELLLIDFLVNLGNLVNPSLAIRMFHIHDFVRSPMEVISDKGYLLVKRFEGVA